MLPDANELVDTLKRAAVEAVEAGKPVNVYFGEVVSASPLKINVEQKIILGEKQLILSRNVTKTEYTHHISGVNSRRNSRKTRVKILHLQLSSVISSLRPSVEI